MKKGNVFIAVALLVAGCGSELSPEEQARSDAADVASVEAAQERRPPMEHITPEPISFNDAERNGFPGSGCSFVPSGSPDTRAVLVTLPKRAIFKRDGKLFVLAADSASAELPFGVWAEYTGRTHALRLARISDADFSFGKPRGWRGSLIITDQFERPVFRTDGRLDCGTQRIKVSVPG